MPKQINNWNCPQLVTRLLSLVTTLLIFNFAFLISGCGLDIEDPTPPSAPIWVQKSLPEEWPERGIDAHESGGIYLEWETNIEEDIVSYQVYKAEYFEVLDSLGEYTLLALLGKTKLQNFDYVDQIVSANVIYYYKIKAVDSAGNISNYSESMGYSVQAQISLNTMIPNGITAYLRGDRKLKWRNDFSDVTEDYCITILTHENELLTREILQPTTYLFFEEHWVIPDSIIFQTGKSYLWRVDTGAIYSDGIEKSGSESLWAMFTYENE